MSNLLKSLDLLGIVPYSLMEGKKAYKSLIGAILTIAALFVSVIAIQYNIINWIDQINPLIFKDTYLNNKPIPVGSNNNKFFMIFTYANIMTGDINTFSEEEVKNIKPIVTYYNITASGNSFERTEMVRCDPDYFNDYSTNGESNYLTKIAFCLPHNIEFQIFSESMTNEAINVLLKYDDVKHLYKGATVLNFLQIGYQRTIIQSQNATNYYTRIWETFPLAWDPYEIKSYNIFYQHEQIIKKNPLTAKVPQFTNDTYSLSSANLDFSVKLPSPVPTIPVINLIFRPEKFTIQTTLKYTQIEDVLAIFGGMFGIIMNSFRSVNQIIGFVDFETYLLNSIFKFHKIDNDLDDINKAKFKSKTSNNDKSLVRNKKLDPINISIRLIKDKAVIPTEEDEFIQRKKEKEKNKSILERKEQIRKEHSKSIHQSKKDIEMELINKDSGGIKEQQVDNQEGEEDVFNKKSKITRHLTKEELKHEIMKLRLEILSNSLYRKEKYVSCMELLKMKLKLKTKRTLSQYEKILCKALDNINVANEYKYSIKNIIDKYVIKCFLFSHTLRPYANFPSLNIDDTGSEQILDDLKESHIVKMDWTKEEVMEELIEDPYDRKNNKLIRFFGYSNA